MPVGAAPPNGMMPGPPMAPPSLPQMPALDALCSHAVGVILQAARFTAKEHVYVGFHAACAKMCELMGGVANLVQLGVHDPAAQVPLLGRIQRIEQMVTAFVGSYMARRSVVTLTDMEKELVVFLRSYNLQPKTTRHVEGGFRYAVPDPATNSEEISLDDDDDEVREVRLEFLDMGVGWFTAFPAIIATFGKIENVDEESWACPNVSDALAEFLDLPANAGRSDDGLGADFEKFLIESLRKEDQKKLSGSDKKLPVRKLPGFWIRHDSMPHERQCTRHVQNAKRAELARLRDEAFGAEAEAASEQLEYAREEEYLAQRQRAIETFRRRADEAHQENMRLAEQTEAQLDEHRRGLKRKRESLSSAPPPPTELEVAREAVVPTRGFRACV